MKYAHANSKEKNVCMTNLKAQQDRHILKTISIIQN